MQSNLFVADNSGARKIQCIKVLGGSKRRFASIGDIIVVSIKDAIPRGKVKKGEIFKDDIVRTLKDFSRADGTIIIPSAKTKNIGGSPVNISSEKFTSGILYTRESWGKIRPPLPETSCRFPTFNSSGVLYATIIRTLNLTRNRCGLRNLLYTGKSDNSRPNSLTTTPP